MVDFKAFKKFGVVTILDVVVPVADLLVPQLNFQIDVALGINVVGVEHLNLDYVNSNQNLHRMLYYIVYFALREIVDGPWDGGFHGLLDQLVELQNTLLVENLYHPLEFTNFPIVALFLFKEAPEEPLLLLNLAAPEDADRLEDSLAYELRFLQLLVHLQPVVLFHFLSEIPQLHVILVAVKILILLLVEDLALSISFLGVVGDHHNGQVLDRLVLVLQLFNSAY